MKNNIINRILACIICYVVGIFFVHSQNYDREAATRYSDQWALGRNKDYFDYTGQGGDCANFVSQCLKAGGLDLSKGGDGNGKGVDTKKCIKTVQNLHDHLNKYQLTKYILKKSTESDYRTESSEMEMGDVVLYGSSDFPYIHSTFCAGTGPGGKNVYNAHTTDHFHKSYYDMSFGSGIAYCFHFKPPAHCSNCIQDEDEEAVDCGGSCPSCDRSAPNKIAYDGTTVPPYSVALEGISIENTRLIGDVELVSAGDIEFLANTEIPAGTSVTTKSTMKKSTIAGDCDVLCNELPISYCVPGKPIRVILANVNRYNLYVYRLNPSRDWYLTYSQQNISVGYDGSHFLPWNTSDVTWGEVLWVRIVATGCKGDTKEYNRTTVGANEP